MICSHRNNGHYPGKFYLSYNDGTLLHIAADFYHQYVPYLLNALGTSAAKICFMRNDVGETALQRIAFLKPLAWLHGYDESCRKLIAIAEKEICLASAELWQFAKLATQDELYEAFKRFANTYFSHDCLAKLNEVMPQLGQRVQDTFYKAVFGAKNNYLKQLLCSQQLQLLKDLQAYLQSKGSEKGDRTENVQQWLQALATNNQVSFYQILHNAPGFSTQTSEYRRLINKLSFALLQESRRYDFAVNNLLINVAEPASDSTTTFAWDRLSSNIRPSKEPVDTTGSINRPHGFQIGGTFGL